MYRENISDHIDSPHNSLKLLAAINIAKFFKVIPGSEEGHRGGDCEF
jgi:hypothetical protein